MQRWLLPLLLAAFVVGLVYFRAVASVEELGVLAPMTPSEVALDPRRTEVTERIPANDGPIAPSSRETPRPAEPPPDSPTIRGRLVDEQGRALAESEVRFVWSDHGRRREIQQISAAQGGFVIELPSAAVRGDLLASAEGHAPALREDLGAGPEEVVLSLRRGRTFAVELHDQDGTPVEAERLALYWILNGRTIGPAAPEEGRWILPPVPFRMHAVAEGHRAGWSGPFDPTTVGAKLVLPVERIPRVRGRVTLQGKLVDSARVTLEPLERTEFGAVSAVTSAYSDHDGRFELQVDGPGRFLPRAFHTQRGVGRGTPFELDGRSEIDDLVIELTEEPGRVAIQVIVPPGLAYDALGIDIAGFRGLEVKPDGTSSLPLVAGDYAVKLSVDRRRLKAGEPSFEVPYPERVASVRVTPGRTSELLFDFTQAPECLLEGELSIERLIGREASLRGAGENWRVSTSLGTNGRFSLGVSEPGFHELEVVLDLLDTTVCWSLRERVELWPGTQRFSFETSVGSLRIHPPDDEHWWTEDLWVRWTDGKREIVAWNSTLDPASGARVFSALPAGTVTIEFPLGGPSQTCEIRAGDETQFVFPPNSVEAARQALRAAQEELPVPIHDLGYY